MQIHPGSFRNHNRWLHETYGRDKGADIPLRDRLRARVSSRCSIASATNRASAVIVFTLDESTYSRELAPLAGHYPVLKLGPGLVVSRQPGRHACAFASRPPRAAGFYNTVGFNDDTRAFLSIPARHDAARRIDCAFLARLVAEHRLEEDEAHRVAADLAYHLPKRAYKLDRPAAT